MADFDDIRRGLAANLTVLRPDYQVSAYLLDDPSPPTLQVAGVESIDYDTGGYGDRADTHSFVIEACFSGTSDIGSQQLLDALLAPTGATSLKAAVEADRTLTSRLLDDGTVQTSQPAAVAYLRVTAYRGQSRFTLPNGTDVLLASWTVEVAT